MGFVHSTIVCAVFICYAVADKIHSIPLKHMDSHLITMLKQNVHPNVIAAMLTAENNSTSPEPLKNNFMDTEYYGEIRLGQPGQMFLVSFDTTWVDSWVPSASCSSMSPPCMARNKYNEKKSRSSIKTPYEFRVKIGSSDLVGNIFYDQLNLNGVNITNQPFAAVSEIPWVFTYSSFDGVFGMSWGPQDKITPVIWNLKKQRIIDQMIFSFYFNRNGGSMVLGGVDPTHNQGDFQYVQLVDSNPPQWMVRVNNITVIRSKNDTIQVCKTGCNAVMKTGGNPIYGPSKEIAAINNLIKAKEFMGRFTVSCSEVPKLPNITIAIGNRPFILEGRDYIHKVEVRWIGGICFSSFVKNYDDKDETWYIGGAFMSRYYTTFDMENGRIGFATAK